MASRPASRSDFEVAIVCALPLEYNAVSLLIDHFWDEDGDPYGRAVADTNTYTTGRIGNFDVVLVLLSDVGKISAASSVASLRSSYPELRLVLLTGICGGVPNPGTDEELLLGDVVISKSVIQYDHGKRYPDSFAVKDTIENSLGRPTKNIRNLITSFETDRVRERLEQRAAFFLQQFQGKSSGRRRRPNYHYPGADKDKLFEASFRHKHHLSPQCVCANCHKSSDPVCEESRKLSCDELGCDDKYVVLRERLETKRQLERNGRTKEAQAPFIFVGPVGSGDMVLKSGEDRDRIAKRDGILAFEMEGAGVWDEIPCIVVKGVCDYADSHKNKSWQAFAAATGASVAKALLEQYTQTDKPLERSSNTVRQHSASSPGSTKDEVVKWLAPVNSAEELSRACKDRVSGTCQWIWDTNLTAWEDSSAPSAQPLFWITGKSGSGKTTLFSSIIDELQLRCGTDKATHKGVGFHCCSLDVAASQLTNNVFGSIFAQMATAHPDVVEYFQPMMKAGTKLIPQNNMTVNQIQEAMQFLLAKFDRFYLMIDALNETPYDDEIIETLISLCEKHANLRVLVTSTREPFRDSGLIFLRKMSEKAVNLDIETYVQQRLLTEGRFKWLDPISQSEVSHRIGTSSDGVFRWAKLCMDQLSRYRTVRDMKAALRDIPTTLNETYAAMLSRIPADDREIAREALTWLCFSLRPLRLRELAEVVVLRENDRFLDNDARLGDPVVLLEICQGLIHSSDDELTLAHDSIRTFLLSDWIRKSKPVAEFAVDPASAHRKIMRKCLTYLSLDEFTSGPVSTRHQLDARFVDYPLLRYASQLWPIHSERFDLQSEDENDILAFFKTKGNSNSGTFGAWVQFLLEMLDLDAIHRTEPLYYAASYNMVPILKILLRPENDVDVNKRGGRYSSTPLFVAVWRGNLEAAKLLYKAGADPHLVDRSGIDSYQMAVYSHLDELVEAFDGSTVPREAEQAQYLWGSLVRRRRGRLRSHGGGFND
ncbi:hypothetical protein MRS44_018345 [Fusarium solani]|uniref:uncharacterized protein n=1 Tax=Fusarium solani TaxID=169388 RepID=UPI0032C40848|nr:hypothetical protein MRS44_018345 [Fusarium solani]